MRRSTKQYKDNIFKDNQITKKRQRRKKITKGILNIEKEIFILQRGIKVSCFTIYYITGHLIFLHIYF